MGMALDESIKNLQMLESNGVAAFIDPKVMLHLKQYGNIKIDYVTRPEGSGYTISVGDSKCSGGDCGSSC